MSCFIVPLAQAVSTTIYRKATGNSARTTIWKSHLPSLEKMLWGGSLVLIVDHIAHGELFTFSLRELIAVGVPMSLTVTAVWAITVAARVRNMKLQGR